jgi:hypothetical protein
VKENHTLVFALAAWLTTSACHAQQTPPPLVISTNKASGVYQVGDTVR